MIFQLQSLFLSHPLLFFYFPFHSAPGSRLYRTLCLLFLIYRTHSIDRNNIVSFIRLIKFPECFLMSFIVLLIFFDIIIIRKIVRIFRYCVRVVYLRKTKSWLLFIIYKWLISFRILKFIFTSCYWSPSMEYPYRHYNIV